MTSGLAAPLLGLLLLAASGPASAQPSLEITTFPVRVGDKGICYASDGNLWLSGVGQRVVTRLTPAGNATYFDVPFRVNLPYPGRCVDGGDGYVWFATGTWSIGRVSIATGEGTVFALPENVGSQDVTRGPDGAIWFTASQYYPFKVSVFRITISGEITEYPLPTEFSTPRAITTGPDGALWFTGDRGQVGRLEANGTGFRFYNLPQYPIEGYLAPGAIVTGPDGNLWFGAVGPDGNENMVRVSPTGTISQFPVARYYGITGVANGPDGAIWFLEGGRNPPLVGRITTSGVLTEYPVTAESPLMNITAGPGLTLWLTGLMAGVGRISLAPSAAGAIPTLNPWMLALLALGVAASAWCLLKPR